MSVLGFADLHNHQFAHLGFGGREFFGAPTGPIDKALPWCTPVHGPGGVADPIGEFMRAAYGGNWAPGHLVGGYPQFDGWPRWDSVTHQTVHVDWLKRAWEGGMRLMVMLAVNSEWMASLPGFVRAPNRSPRDMEAVNLQLDAAYALQDDLDDGNPGDGWYRIVRSAGEALDVIAAGRLAVVLGIEVDYLFDGYPDSPPTAGDVRNSVQAYYDRGVRFVFPLHFADNAYGGTALQNPMESAGIAIDIPTPLGDITVPYVLETTDGSAMGYDRSVLTTGGMRAGLRNVAGLTDLGRVLIEELMGHNMLFDVDHMSWQTRNEVLDIATAANYPVISGHSGFIDVLLGDKRHEGQQTGKEVDRIRGTGGMVAPIIAQGSLAEVSTFKRPDSTYIAHIAGGSSNSFIQAYLYAVERMKGGPVGLGTDFNGFAGVPRPTNGDGAEDPSIANFPRVGETFISAVTGQQMERCKAGDRTFDINDDGLVHVGMLPDLIAAMQVQGVRDDELAPLLHSAEAFALVWRKAEPRTTGDHFYTCSKPEADNAVAKFGYELEGAGAPACYVYPSQVPDLAVPLHRLFSAGQSDHFYTTSDAELGSAVAGGDYVSEGPACWVEATQKPGTVPLYRLVSLASADHFYTTSKSESDDAVARGDYKLEGVQCYIFNGKQPDTGPLYRLVNPANGDHFYVTSTQERDGAISSYGYKLEGTAGYVYTSAPTGHATLFRLYNDGNGDHFYTTSASERDSAMHGGYRFEGTACYVDGSRSTGSVPFYRLANASNGDHFYTASKAEADNAVPNAGYTLEGIQCYVFAIKQTGTVPLWRLVKVL